MSRAILKPIVSKLREAIIKGVAGKLEKYGFDENGKLVVKKPLSEYDETIRDNLVVLFEAKGINTQEKYVDYIHNTSRTFMHILICFKLMEKRGIMGPLLERVIGTDIYNEIIPDFVSVNPMAFDEFVKLFNDDIEETAKRHNNEENREYYEFVYLIEKLAHEMSKEVPLLFKEYEYNLIQPDYIHMKNILHEIRTIPHNEYGQDDFLGWIYQYWVDIDKCEIKESKKVQDISYANNIFYQVLLLLDIEQTEYGEFYTPRWVVKYVVDNSIQHYRDNNDVTIDKIKLLDPACGAGNFLVYAFDSLLEIYNEEHTEWSAEEKIASILENNIYGADVQREPLQITALNLWIKAKTHATTAKIEKFNLYNVNVLMANSLYPWETEEEFHQITLWDTPDTITKRKYSSEDIGHLLSSRNESNRNNVIRFFKQKFDIVVMNPPFVDARKMNADTLELLKKYYPSNCRNTFGAFIERAIQLLKYTGILGMVCSDTFLTLGSFEYVRNMLLEKRIMDAYLLGDGVFDGPTVNSAILIVGMKKNVNNKIYIHNSSNIDDGKYILQKELFLIKGHPFIFNITENMRQIMSQRTIGDYDNMFEVRKGIVTANNDLFLKYYWEVPKNLIGTDFIRYNRRHQDFLSDTIYVIDWRNDTQKQMLKSPSARCAYLLDNFNYSVKNSTFKEGVAFSLNGRFRCCLLNSEMVFDVDTPAVLISDSKYMKYVLAYLKSDWVQYLVRVINNSASTTPGDVRKIPIVFPDEEVIEKIDTYIDQILEDVKQVRSFHMTSNYYKQSPLAYGLKLKCQSLEEAYCMYRSYIDDLNAHYKSCMQEINKLIYEIYQLDENDKTIIDERIDKLNTFVDAVSLKEAVLLWLKEIYIKEITGKPSLLYPTKEICQIIISYIEEKFGVEMVENIENEIGDLNNVINNGINVNGKTIYFWGNGSKDINEPFIHCKVIAGKGKDKECIIWYLSQFLIEFEEDKRYAMQNEIRRLTKEVYLPKLQRAKEKLQVEGLSASDKKNLQKEVSLYEECVKTLENWKVVD